MKKKIVILGSSGSVGMQTLDIVRANRDEFDVVGLAANRDSEIFKKQVAEFSPEHVFLASTVEDPKRSLAELAALPEADLIVNAVSGCVGFFPAYGACKAGKKMVLANKESIVMAGELIMDLAKKTGAQILPVDSEMSAVWQLGKPAGLPYRSTSDTNINKRSIDSGNGEVGIEKLILTASGGPFYGRTRKELENVTVEQTLRHPTWRMGAKVSVDSATLMNKAFELIEAHWLFGVPMEKIEAVIHRQSLVHGLVQFTDGNMQAVLGAPDMRIPLSYALFLPDRKPNNLPRIDLSKLNLTFEKPDYSILEGPKLACEIMKMGGIMPSSLCIADEEAVNKFLKGEISFLGIYDHIKRSIEKVKNTTLSIEAIKHIIQF